MAAGLKNTQLRIPTDQHIWLVEQAHRNKLAGNKELDSMNKLVLAAIDDYRKKTEQGRHRQ